MTGLPAALASALTEPGCFVDSHRLANGAWAHRAVYTGADAPPAVSLGAGSPSGFEQMYRQQAARNRVLCIALEAIASGVPGDVAQRIAKEALR